MTVEAAKPLPRIHLGPLKTATQIRVAFRRVGQAVLDGKIVPRVAGAAAYCIAGAARALELELAAQLSSQLAQIAHTPPPSGLLQHAAVDVEYAPR